MSPSLPTISSAAASSIASAELKRALTAAAIVFASCAKSDEERVRRATDDAVAALESGDVGGAMDFVADDYADERQNDKTALKGMLAAQVFRGTRVTIVRRDEKVKVTGTTATTTVDTALFRGDRKKLGGILPERYGTYRFTIAWRKDGGDWLVTGVTWEVIPATSFIVNHIE